MWYYYEKLIGVGMEKNKVAHKKIIFGSIIVVAAVAIATLFFVKHDNKKIKFVAAYEYAQASAVMDVIKENKLFEKYMPDGIEIEWTSIDSGSDRRDALATGRVMVAMLETTKAIPAIEKGYPIQLLANGTKSMSAVYTTNPDIQTPNDLAGKKIAYQGAKDIVFKSDMKRNFGIDFSDDQFLSVNEADLISLLVTNRVDGAILTNTMVEKAQALNPDIRLVRDLTNETEYVGIANWFLGNSDFFKQHPDLLQPTMSAYTDAINEINNNLDGVAEMLSPLFNMTVDQIKHEFQTFPACVEIYGYDRMANILYEYKYLDSPAKPFEELPNYESIPKK